MTQDSLPHDAHINFMGNISFSVSPLTRLEIMAASSFFGEPQYYVKGNGGGAKKGKSRRGRVASTPVTLSEAELRELHKELNGFDPYEWRSLSPAARMERAIDEALKFDAEATLQLAARLRQQDLVRHTPQIILVRAANHPIVRGSGLVRQYAPAILRRADELSLQLGYQLVAYPETDPHQKTGKRIPNALTRVWRTALETFSEYEIAKYQQVSLYGKRLRDVANLARPRAALNSALTALMKGSLKLEGRTWESLISEQGSSAETWQDALNKMGHMALLRNLRNLALKSEVDAEVVAQKLLEGVAGGKQLPFRYYSAYRAVEAQAVAILDQIDPKALSENVEQDAIQRAGRALMTYLAATESALDASVQHLPRLPGRTMALADNSGSAQGVATSEMGSMKVSTIGNLTSILAAQMADAGYVGVFGDGLQVVPIQQKGTVLSYLKQCEDLALNIGLGTENGIWLFWENAIAHKIHWDNIFIFSDMQAGHGQLYGTDDAIEAYQNKFGWMGGRMISIPALVAAYRKKVNPKVNVFCVQISGYEDALMPENYYRTAILGGWGTGLLKYAAALAALWDSLEGGRQLTVES